MLRGLSVCVAAASLAVTGCGVLSFPMVVRLNAEEQKKVDDAWINMLTPAGRLDRQTLRDALVARQLHEAGVDELRLVSKKRVSGGLVVMEVEFDREHPGFDGFTLTYMNPAGLELRRERFTFEEVRDSVRLGAVTPESFAADPEHPTPEEAALMQQRAAEVEARLKAVQAAFRPVGAPDEPEQAAE